MASFAENKVVLDRLIALGKSLQPPNETIIQLATAIQMGLQKDFSEDQMDWIDRITDARTMAIADARLITLPNEEIMEVGKRFKQTAVSQLYGRLLYAIILMFKPKNALELGTGMGSSTMYQCAGLEANQSGKMTTIELHEPTSSFAEKNMSKLGVTRASFRVGSFQDLLVDILVELGSVDYVFIDGHHQEGPTVSYFHKVLSHLTSTAIIIFDDISWSDGMKRAWETIQDDARVKVAVDLERMGVCIISDTLETKDRFKIEVS